MKKYNKATTAGTCQICQRQQKLPGGILAKHGYTTRHGYFTGTCKGSDSAPLEETCDYLKLIRNGTERFLKTVEAPVRPNVDGLNWRERNNALAPYEQKVGQIRGAELFVAKANRIIADWKPGTVKPVAVIEGVETKRKAVSTGIRAAARQANELKYVARRKLDGFAHAYRSIYNNDTPRRPDENGLEWAERVAPLGYLDEIVWKSPTVKSFAKLGFKVIEEARKDRSEVIDRHVWTCIRQQVFALVCGVNRAIREYNSAKEAHQQLKDAAAAEKAR
tara:strand:+ start:1895 stop:2725 length:831 start_codon:yes stop_codon:yes gene_type:complete